MTSNLKTKKDLPVLQRKLVIDFDLLQTNYHFPKTKPAAKTKNNKLNKHANSNI